MNRYQKMTEPELDSLLLLAFDPTKREKLNLSTREMLFDIVMEKISNAQLETEFGENVAVLLPSHEKYNELGFIIFASIFSDIRLIKMAALKTYDENKEFF